MSLLASTIDVMLSRANITTVDAFAELLLSAPTFIANFIRSEAAAAAAAGRHAAEIGTMTDASVVDMGTQATADDAVDTATAEAMIAEALRMVDEANERERLAEERARSWQGYAELGRSLLQAAEDRTDRAQAEREVAERSAAAERAAKQMAEQLLAAEAALADAAETRAEYECRARWQAEAQRDVWQVLAGSRGGRGGRGGRGHAPPPVEPRQPPPPPPPPLPQLISLVLAVHIANEGQMSEVEALAILNVTERRPKWLLSQVHPDKHPDFSAEATAATARVNQAMDVRSRHVTEV